jgi:addiction module RelB/DinJ family antitoxin
MTEQLRYRIDSRLKKKAERVLDELGCDPSAAISMFYAQIVRARALPFRPSEFPALDEYGATVEEAQRAVERAKDEIERDRKAGKLVAFKGRL